MAKPQRVLVSGSTGLIGSALVPVLHAKGHTVVRLVRSRAEEKDDRVLWDPESGKLEGSALAGIDSVVHLAGESIAAGRWTEEEKRRILDSRARSTRLLCESLAALPELPRTMICASAMGYYGERSDEPLTEKEPPGEGFLCEVVREWEKASEPASQCGIRAVNLRFGIVLSQTGGTLGELLPLFRIGLGGPLAGGRQFFSWISIRDAVATIQFALDTATLSGPVNVVSPNPIRQREFARILGRVMNRPAWFNVPRWALRLRVGKEFADTILWSQRIVPEKLLASGYRFRHPDLEAALRDLLENHSSR